MVCTSGCQLISLAAKPGMWAVGREDQDRAQAGGTECSTVLGWASARGNWGAAVGVWGVEGRGVVCSTQQGVYDCTYVCMYVCAYVNEQHVVLWLRVYEASGHL